MKCKLFNPNRRGNLESRSKKKIGIFESGRAGALGPPVSGRRRRRRPHTTTLPVDEEQFFFRVLREMYGPKTR